MTRLTATGAAAWPAVDVVVAAQGHSEALRRSVASVLGQDYPAAIRVLVVSDRPCPDDLVRAAPAAPRHPRVVDVRRNSHSPGTPGARNCGIEAATAPLVAFCDVGDVWLDRKLRRQVAVLRSDPSAVFVTMGVRMRCRGHSHDRVVHEGQLDTRSLMRDRLALLHPSTFVMSREAVVTGIGPLDEADAGARVADLEFLARATRWAPLRNLPEVGVEVARRAHSVPAGPRPGVAAELTWLLDACPELSRAPTAEARVCGQIALATAAEGDRRAAARWAGYTLTRNVTEPRAYLALAVAGRLVNARGAARLLNVHNQPTVGILG
jgi:glycosyltransferase involved in cell wall biosynthesis